ncbi:hypothetical protein ACIQYF_02870 [Pseudomonas sp. NPDC096917]|uniref:hypothetical protein n=1 Tax=Pseudomonas sp. NPDC096917 TaxID=3364483 RepID=UPI00383A2820
MKPRQSSFRKVFCVPLAIALVTGAGLFAALLGDGTWDVLSWIGLGIPTWISVRGLLKR